MIRRLLRRYNVTARRVARQLAQLATGGALTALVAALTDGLAPRTVAIVMAAWTALVTGLQNAGEERGTIPTVLPTSSSSHAGEEVSLPLVRARRAR